uniref:Uncharacterized protein n=1 Tax=Suncus murinus ribovirus 2 TaxID=3139576 RepID=A0AB38ZKC2_9VIRU
MYILHHLETFLIFLNLHHLGTGLLAGPINTMSAVNADQDYPELESSEMLQHTSALKWSKIPSSEQTEESFSPPLPKKNVHKRQVVDPNRTDINRVMAYDENFPPHPIRHNHGTHKKKPLFTEPPVQKFSDVITIDNLPPSSPPIRKPNVSASPPIVSSHPVVLKSEERVLQHVSSSTNPPSSLSSIVPPYYAVQRTVVNVPTQYSKTPEVVKPPFFAMKPSLISVAPQSKISISPPAYLSKGTVPPPYYVSRSPVPPPYYSLKPSNLSSVEALVVERNVVPPYYVSRVYSNQSAPFYVDRPAVSPPYYANNLTASVEPPFYSKEPISVLSVPHVYSPSHHVINSRQVPYYATGPRYYFSTNDSITNISISPQGIVSHDPLLNCSFLSEPHRNHPTKDLYVLYETLMHRFIQDKHPTPLLKAIQLYYSKYKSDIVFDWEKDELIKTMMIMIQSEHVWATFSNRLFDDERLLLRLSQHSRVKQLFYENYSRKDLSTFLSYYKPEYFDAFWGSTWNTRSLQLLSTSGQVLDALNHRDEKFKKDFTESYFLVSKDFLPTIDYNLAAAIPARLKPAHRKIITYHLLKSFDQSNYKQLFKSTYIPGSISTFVKSGHIVDTIETFLKQELQLESSYVYDWLFHRSLAPSAISYLQKKLDDMKANDDPRDEFYYKYKTYTPLTYEFRNDTIVNTRVKRSTAPDLTDLISRASENVNRTNVILSNVSKSNDVTQSPRTFFSNEAQPRCLIWAGKSTQAPSISQPRAHDINNGDGKVDSDMSDDDWVEL